MMISVTPQQMLDILIKSGMDVLTSKAILLDLILASEGGLVTPEVVEIESAEDPVIEEVEFQEEPDPVVENKASRRKTKRVNFSAFGGSAENLK